MNTLNVHRTFIQTGLNPKGHAVLFSLSAAAKAVGKGKSTLHNAIRSGRLSATRNADGTYSIDASELARVYGLNPPSRTLLDAGEPPSEPHETELAVLRAKLAMLEDQLARERQVSGETVSDLRKRLDRAEERVLALSALSTPQPSHAAHPLLNETAASDLPKVPKSFLARLLRL